MGLNLPRLEDRRVGSRLSNALYLAIYQLVVYGHHVDFYEKTARGMDGMDDWTTFEFFVFPSFYSVLV